MLKQRYTLETDLLHGNLRSKEVTEEIKQAKFDERAAQEALWNYESSIRGFLHRISGKREENLEDLNGKLRRCQQHLSGLLREQDALVQKRNSLTAALQALPSLEELRETVERKEWARLEARYCAEALTPLLEENHRALLEYRELMQGQRPDILSPARQQEIYSGPDIWAAQCQPLIQRLKTALDILNIPFEIGGYYSSPTAYLVTAAAIHNRRDRVNQALDQNLSARKVISQILDANSELAKILMGAE